MKKLWRISYLCLLAGVLTAACSSAPREAAAPETMPKPELVYVYDPMCGWCYGFTPVMLKIQERYGDKLRITVLSGGLATGSRVEPIREVYSRVKHALPRVTSASGVPFGEKFLKNIAEEGSYLYNSEPPCIALTVVKELAPAHALAFARKMQNAFFYEGKSLNETATYLELIKSFGITEEAFLKRFGAPEYKERTYAEFDEARRLGASGFPTVLLRAKGQTRILSQGFMSYENLSSQLDAALK